MATNRLFAFNNGPAIGDALQYGNLSISTSVIDGYRWWPGPDEDIGYIIAHDDTNPNMRTEGSRYATVSTNSVGFWRTSKTDVDFLSVFNGLFSKSYSSAPNAAYWLNTNGYWTSYSPELPLVSQSFVFGYSASTYNGTTIGGISDSGAFVKLDTDGTLDNTFSVGSGFEWTISGNKANILTISIQSDGKIIAGGQFDKYNGATANGLIRLNTDGSIDNTFNLIFTQDTSSVITTEIQPDGKILVGGNLRFLNNGIISNIPIARLNNDGTSDVTFNQNIDAYQQTLQNNPQPKFIGVPYDIVVRPDGKIIVANIQGKLENFSTDIGIFNSDGSIDNSTTTKLYSATEGYVYTIALQPDGKILMGGTFVTYGNSSASPYLRRRLVRLNSDLTLDETFYTGNTGTNLTNYGPYYPYGFDGYGFNGTVEKVIVQYDGKILVGGSFTIYQGVTSNSIIRLNSDGSIDNTFNVGTGFTNVLSLKLQADGKVIVVGQFNSYNGNSCNGIARLNSDGSFDNTFTIGTGFNFTPGYPISVISE
mgnify:FL=1|jgi:uncharacterized delta-60 repeat protein